MAADRISDEITKLVNKFMREQNGNEMKLSAVPGSKRKLHRSVYKCLNKYLSMGSVDICAVRENYSVEGAIECIIEKMKSAGNYPTAESFSACLKNLSDNKEQFSENIERCLRFILALYEMNENENSSQNDSLLNSEEKAELISENPVTVWYGDLFAPKYGVLHMYASDIFNIEDPILNPKGDSRLLLRHNHNLESHTHASSSGMCQDLHMMTIFSPPSSLEDSMIHSRCDNQGETSPVGIECGIEWNSLSDDGYVEQNSFSSGTSVFVESLDNDCCSRFLLDNSNEDNVRTENVYTKKKFEVKDSLYHTSRDELYIEQQFCTPAILLHASDVARMLIGLTANSFCIEKSCCFPSVFSIDDDKKVSAGDSMLSDFVIVGSCFTNLYRYSHGPHSRKSSSQEAFKNGIGEYLLCFEAAIASIYLNKLEHPLALKYKFNELGENIRSVASLCGLDGGGNDRDLEHKLSLLPVGVAFIDYLYERADAYGSGHAYLAYIFLLKRALSPYLRFLQLWLFEGVCSFEREEFCLQKNMLCEEVKDETYWLSCYTTSTEDLERLTPVFLREMATDIFICGKSFNLLKLVCPDHHLFAVDVPAPDFEIGFTEATVRNILRKGVLSLLTRISCMIDYLRKKMENSLEDEVTNQNLLSLLHHKSKIEERTSEISLLLHEFNDDEEEDANLSEDQLDSSNSFTSNEGIYSKPFDEHDYMFEPKKEDSYGVKAIDSLTDQIMKCVLGSRKVKDGELRYFQRQHVSSMINLSLHPMMKAQIDLVNESVLNYFFDVLKIKDHFFSLTNYFCLRDGEFGQSFFQQLSELVDPSNPSYDIANSARLHTVLVEALGNCISGDSINASLLSLQAIDTTTSCTLPRNVVGVLKLIQLNYQIQWPCNIIITEEQLSAYNKVFRFLLELQYVLSMLKDMYFIFKKQSKDKPEIVNHSSQYRSLQFFRHEMQHFVMAVKTYIGREVLDVAWHEFEETMKNKAKDLEALRAAHFSFISKVINICMLDAKSRKVLTILRKIFRGILNLYRILKCQAWFFNVNKNLWEHGGFRSMQEEFKNYRVNVAFFYNITVGLCQMKYRTYLENLLLIVDFNSYYKHSVHV